MHSAGGMVIPVVKESSPDEAKRNPGKRVPVVMPAPDWHPGYKTLQKGRASSVAS